MKIGTRKLSYKENKKAGGQSAETINTPENFLEFQRGMIEDTYDEKTEQLIINSKTELTFLNQVNNARYIVYDLIEIQKDTEDIIGEILKSQKAIDITVKKDDEILFYPKERIGIVPRKYLENEAIKEHLRINPEPKQIPLEKVLKQIFQ